MLSGRRIVTAAADGGVVACECGVAGGECRGENEDQLGCFHSEVLRLG